MVLEFQLQLAMTEISARNCLDESGHSSVIGKVSRTSPKKHQRGKTDDSAPTERG